MTPVNICHIVSTLNVNSVDHHRPELHLLAEGQVVSSLHHHLNQLAQFGFDLDGMDRVSQDAHIPEWEKQNPQAFNI